MSRMDKSENVKQQYHDDKNLSIRTKLHLKYSTNKQGFFSWLFEKYDFPGKCKILEVGCGNGAQWENRLEKLPESYSLTLSDYSKGMLDVVIEKYSKYYNVSFEQIDIQDINFADETFDLIIFN